MLSPAQIAFNNADIRDTVLANLIDGLNPLERYSALLVTSLISRCWYRPSQIWLHDFLAFQYGTVELEEWLESVATRKETLTTSHLIFEDDWPFKEGGKWSYDVIGRVLQQVKGLRTLTIALKGQSELPAEWLALNSLAGLSYLCISSPFGPSKSSIVPSFALNLLRLEEYYPDFDRNWSHTCSLLTRTRAGRPLDLVELELCGFKKSSCLVPSFPLASDLVDSSQGSLLPFTSCLHRLAISTLLPHADSFNFAIFGSAASSLQYLRIETLTPESHKLIPLLRFFPNLIFLKISRFISLPFVGILSDFHLERFEREEGKGDVLAELVALISSNGLPNLKSLVFDSWKHLSRDYGGIVEETLEKKGVRLFLTDGGLLPLTEEEIKECQKLEAELVYLSRQHLGLEQAIEAAVTEELEKAKVAMANLEEPIQFNGVETMSQGERETV